MDPAQSQLANLVFSLCAAAGSALVSVLAAVKGDAAVSVVFGLLAVGFLVRAAERRRRRR